MIRKGLYPTCDKLAAVSDEYRHIMEFLCNIKSELATYQETDGITNMHPIRNMEGVVLEYLGIDPVELEKERRTILKNIKRCITLNYPSTAKR